ncbi:MAG TPA: CARDB domain-containing protein [Solirubrobacteraceae bacterium]|nr:CARDB domain-containing protein [Solirubrobacteraceae bacterium]
MTSDSSLARFARAAGAVSAAVAVVCMAGASTGVASTHHGPDLVIKSLVRAPTALMPGSTFSERFTEANRGDRRADATTTRFYLSRARHLARSAFPLRGTIRIQALKAGRTAKASAWLTVSAATPKGSYTLIACANDHHRLKERNTRNDCRVAKGRIAVTSSGSAGKGGGSGGASGGSGGGAGATGSVCVPTRHPALSSADPRCFDGDAAHGIFVSGVGDDTNPGTIMAPKRTLAAAVGLAFAQGKDLYVSEGVFPETLKLASGVGVYGGYDTSWQRSPSNITRITGSSATSDAADASGIVEPTSLQLVTLEPSLPTTPGDSSYGLHGAGSPGLVLDHVSIFAAPGAPGAAGPNGAQGASGGNGKAGDTNIANGGSSPAWHSGGDGGDGSEDGDNNGHDGAQGESTTPDMWGESGGPGGQAGLNSSNPQPGGRGFVGGSGHFGAEGAGGGAGNAAPPNSGTWLSEPGHDGQAGSPGHGGGGGGGGGSDGCTVGFAAVGGQGGGGGGGGAGGGGGTGGQGGGGSFGVFLENSTGALIRNSSVNASDGGAGGRGGAFGFPGGGGAGGPGQPGMPGGGLCTAGAAAGGSGGQGGSGGVGGNGGGGAGGPSVAIFGLTASASPGTTVSHKHGGAGSPGSGGAGAMGVAADYL